MKLKRAMALTMAGILAAGAVGCGKKNDTPDTTKQPETQTTTAATAGTSAATEGKTEGTTQAPAADEVTRINLMLKTDPTYGDWNDFWCLDIIEQYCGIRFEVEQVTAEGWDEKKNLAFATNSLPDAFLNDLTDAELATYGGQGLILPLEKYMTRENMPAFFDVVDNEGFPDLVSAMTFPDGHVYALRGVNGSEREYAKNRSFINKQWAENLGVKLPTNLDEYYTYLKAIKDGDPNGNGDTTDEIPLGGSYNESGSSYYDGFIPILTAFGFTEEKYEVFDGKVVYVPAQDTYKEFLKYMHKLYSEGLIDQEYFTQTADQRKAKEALGLVGAFTDYASWLNIPDREIWSQYGSIEPMTSEYNDKKLWPAKEAIFYGALVITNQVKDEAVVEKLMKFCDWCYSEEGTELLWRGPELGTWEEYPESGWVKKEDPFGIVSREFMYPEGKFESSSQFQTSLVKPGNNYWPYATIPSRQDPQPLIEEKYTDPEVGTSYVLTYDIVTNQAPYYHTGWPATIKFTAKESEEMSLIETDLNNYKETMESKMIIGDLDVDATFDEFVKGLESRQLGRYLEILQTAYDRYAAASK